MTSITRLLEGRIEDVKVKKMDPAVNHLINDHVTVQLLAIVCY